MDLLLAGSLTVRGLSSFLFSFIGLLRPLFIIFVAAGFIG
jgi:hypothetical protein